MNLNDINKMKKSKAIVLHRRNQLLEYPLKLLTYF